MCMIRVYIIYLFSCLFSVQKRIHLYVMKFNLGIEICTELRHIVQIS
jgi:hypothetical protein